MSDAIFRTTSRRGALQLITTSLMAPLVTSRLALANPGGRTMTPACGRALTASDAEGPFFKPHSPQTKDLAATVGDGMPLLLTGRVLDSCGQPVAGALLDVWQANAQGIYDRTGFALRGHQFTEADGGYSVRTVAPKWYAAGPGGPPPLSSRSGALPPGLPFKPPPFGPPPSELPPGTPKIGLAGPALARRGPPPGGGVRAPHLHIKLQAPAGGLLTTQLFLPDSLTLYGRAVAPLNRQDGLFRRELIIDTQGPADGGALVGRFDFFINTRI